MLLRVGGARLAEHVPVLCGLIRMGSIELVERCQFKLGAMDPHTKLTHPTHDMPIKSRT